MEEQPKEKETPLINNAEVARDVEKAALQVQARLKTQALPIRQYLEATVAPVVMQGMQALIRERPDDPLEYLGTYLLKESAKRKVRKDGSAPAASK